MNRWYIVPIITIDDGGLFVRVPKYFNETNLTRFMTDYGTEDTGIVYVKGIDQVTHDTISANSDVLSAPENIDQNLTAGAVTIVSNYLESMSIPGDWVTTLFTYRDLIKIIEGIFQLNGKYAAIDGSNESIIAKANNNLELQYQDLPADVKIKLNAVANDFDPILNSDNIVSTSTVRFILFDIGKQFMNRDLTKGGDTF